MGYAKICEEIKRGKCPEPQKKRKRVRREVKMDRKKKSETRGKNGQVSGVELGVQRCPPERKKMDKCPTVELGLFTSHLKKKNIKKRGSPCSPKAKIKKEER